MRAIGRALRGIGTAVGSRPWLFVSVALGVFALDILVPPLVLSVARKAVTSFTINPLLSTLPEYLTSGRGVFEERLAKVWGLALFWFSSDGQFGIEWGFAVTPSDLARFVFMSLLVAAYFALWLERRARVATAWGARAARSAGARSPRRGDAGAALEPEREVGRDEERHEHEAREIGRGHREAPLDAELPVRREPEEGEAPDLGEALLEDATSRGQVLRQGRQERIDGEGGDGLARDGENEGRHEDVEGEDTERHRDEEPGP